MTNYSFQTLPNVSFIDDTMKDHSFPKAFRATVITIISLAIIVSNFVNIMVLGKTKQIHKISRIFLTNLGTADLCMGLFTCLPSFGAAVLNRWPYGAIWCQISGIAHSTTLTISIWTIAAISFERYLAVLHPLKYKTSLSKIKCMMIIAIMWIIALLSYTSMLFTKSNFTYYQFNVKSTMCGMHWENVGLCVATAMYVPILSGCTITFTTFKIYKALKARTMLSKNTTNNHNFPSRRRRDKSVVKLLMATTGAYFLCVSPYCTVTLPTVFFKSVVPPDWLEFLVTWLANSNSLFNLIVYVVIYDNFRQEAKVLFGRICGNICTFICGRKCNTRRIEPELDTTTQ